MEGEERKKCKKEREERKKRNRGLYKVWKILTLYVGVSEQVKIRTPYEFQQKLLCSIC